MLNPVDEEGFDDFGDSFDYFVSQTVIFVYSCDVLWCMLYINYLYFLTILYFLL